MGEKKSVYVVCVHAVQLPTANRRKNWPVWYRLRDGPAGFKASEKQNSTGTCQSKLTISTERMLWEHVDEKEGSREVFEGRGFNKLY